MGPTLVRVPAGCQPWSSNTTKFTRLHSLKGHAQLQCADAADSGGGTLATADHCIRYYAISVGARRRACACACGCSDRAKCVSGVRCFEWRLAQDGPCWYASPASRGVLVQHRFCDARSSDSGTVYACCPVERDSLAYDCGKKFGRCACVGVGCPKAWPRPRRRGRSGRWAFSCPSSSSFPSFRAACRGNGGRPLCTTSRATPAWPSGRIPTPQAMGTRRTMVGRGWVRLCTSRIRASAGTAGARARRGLLEDMLAGAFDSGSHDAEDGQHQDMGGGGDISADMGFGE